MPKRAIKILLNLVLIAKDALVRGGELHVGAEAREGAHEIVIRAVGPKIILDGTVRDTLTGAISESEIDSRTAAAWMVRNLCSTNGGFVQIASPEEGQLVVGAVVR
jgi:histidine phosphotransferase ChpT